MNKSTADISASEVEGSASALPSRRDPKHQDGQHLSVSLSACLFCPSIVCISVGIPPHVSRSLSIGISVCRSVCLSIGISACLFFSLFLLLSVCFCCFCIFACISVTLSI